MNNVYLHTKNNLSRIVIKYIILLIPFIIYGIYKNGVLLYLKNTISFIGIFKVLYLIIIAIIIDFIRRIIFRQKFHLDLDFLSCFTIPLFMPININYLIYVVALLLLIIIHSFCSKYIYINKISFIILGIYLVLLCFNNLNFFNILESSNIYSFNTLDLFNGRNIGGIASSNIIYALIFLIIVAFINNYKHYLTISVIVSYILCTLLFKGFSIDILINSTVIVGSIFVFIDTRKTPDKVGICLIYGFLIGLLTSILGLFINNYLIIFISITIISIIYPLISFKKKDLGKKV